MRPELWGWGQFLEIEAKAKAKNNHGKYQIMINNICFKIIAVKINKIPEFYTIFDRKMPDYITRQRDWGQAEDKCLRLRWGRRFNAEAESSRPRPKFWPRGYFGLEDLTSLNNHGSDCYFFTNNPPTADLRDVSCLVLLVGRVFLFQHYKLISGWALCNLTSIIISTSRIFNVLSKNRKNQNCEQCHCRTFVPSAWCA